MHETAEIWNRGDDHDPTKNENEGGRVGYALDMSDNMGSFPIARNKLKNTSDTKVFTVALIVVKNIKIYTELSLREASPRCSNDIINIGILARHFSLLNPP